MNRLDRVMSNLGYCSRKEVGKLIRQGRLTVDGKPPASAAVKVDPASVRLDDEPLDPAPPLVLLLNKPAGYACSHDDHPPLVYSLLPERFGRRKPKLSSVGRLDKDTTGVLVITDDGQLLHRLTSPKHKVEKVYQVKTRDPLSDEDLGMLTSGELELDGSRLLPARASLRAPNHLELVLVEGRFHQVKRMLELLGNEVVELHRSAFGGLELDGLAEGEFRRLETLPTHWG